jgi:putative membrane protein
MTGPEMFHSGLQSERTFLAWRRTSLSLLVGSVVSYRVLAPAIGWWSVVVGTLGLVVTVVVWLLARRRSRRSARALADGVLLSGGGLLLFLGGSVALAAVIGLLYVLG